MTHLPTTVTACVIRNEDGPGIRREMTEAAREGLRVVLDAERVGVLEKLFVAMESTIERLASEAYAYDR